MMVGSIAAMGWAEEAWVVLGFIFGVFFVGWGFLGVGGLEVVFGFFRWLWSFVECWLGVVFADFG